MPRTHVVVTGAFELWYGGLNVQEQTAVDRVVGLLEGKGVALPFPYSSAIAGARFPLRELRTQAKGEPVRVFYAFDPRRQAVLLLGGNKAGDDRFYERMIPLCERLWAEYLAESS